MNADAAVIKQISRAGRRRTVAQPLRTWDASQESLRNFTGKTHRRDAPSRCSLSPSVYLSGLSQAPHVMHRRRFSFSVHPMSDRGKRKQEGECLNGKDNCWDSSFEYSAFFLVCGGPLLSRFDREVA